METPSKGSPEVFYGLRLPAGVDPPEGIAIGEFEFTTSSN